MNFIKQYLKIVSCLCTGLVFAFACFYLLANLYHYFELKKDFAASFDNQLLVTEIDETLSKVSENINKFDLSTYTGSVPANKMALIKQNLTQCINSFNNETINTLRGKDRITIVDVYKLRESYEDNILSDCVVNNLHWLTTIDSSFGSTYLVDNKDITKLYIDSLLSSTTYLKKDLLNNSSYYYNTSISSSSIKDNTRDGFYEVIDAYNRAAKLVLYVSDWFRMEVKYS